METDATSISVEAEASRVVLSPVDRARIEAFEQYRFEVRESLDERRSARKERQSFWLEKVVAPGLIVVLTAGLGGYLVPRVLAASEDARRDAESRAKIIEDVAQTTAEIQAVVDGKAAALEAYWTDAARANAILVEFAVRRDLGEMSSETFAAQDGLLENDRKRIQDRSDASEAEYQRQIKTFKPWLRRTRARLAILYSKGENRQTLEKSLALIEQSMSQCDAALDKTDKLYDAALNSDIQAIKVLRARLNAGALSPDAYRSQVDVIVRRLRDLPKVKGPPHLVDESAVTAMIEVLRSTETDLAL